MDLSAYEQRQAVHTRTSRIIGIFRNASVGADLSILVSGPGGRVVGGILMSVSEMVRPECGFLLSRKLSRLCQGSVSGSCVGGYHGHAYTVNVLFAQEAIQTNFSY